MGSSSLWANYGATPHNDFLILQLALVDEVCVTGEGDAVVGVVDDEDEVISSNLISSSNPTVWSGFWFVWEFS